MQNDNGRGGVTYIGPRAFAIAFCAVCALFLAIFAGFNHVVELLDASRDVAAAGTPSIALPLTIRALGAATASLPAAMPGASPTAQATPANAATAIGAAVVPLTVAPRPSPPVRHAARPASIVLAAAASLAERPAARTPHRLQIVIVKAARTTVYPRFERIARPTPAALGHSLRTSTRNAKRPPLLTPILVSAKLVAKPDRRLAPFGPSASATLLVPAGAAVTVPATNRLQPAQAKPGALLIAPSGQ